jgi:hypothetical protein
VLVVLKLVLEVFGLLLAGLLEEIEFVVHRSDDEVVLAFLVVLALLFRRISRPLRGLRTFMDLLTFVFESHNFFSLYKLTPLDVPGCHDRLPSPRILSTNHWQLEVVRSVHLRVFGPLSDWRSGQPLLIPRL